MLTGFVDVQPIRSNHNTKRAQRLTRVSPLVRETTWAADSVRSGRLIALGSSATALASPIYRNRVEKDRGAGIDPAIEHVLRQRDRQCRPVLLLDQVFERCDDSLYGNLPLPTLLQ